MNTTCVRARRRPGIQKDGSSATSEEYKRQDRDRHVTQPYLVGDHLRKIVNDNIDTTPLNESTNRPLPLFQTGAVRYDGNDMLAKAGIDTRIIALLLSTSPSSRDPSRPRMPSAA